MYAKSQPQVRSLSIHDNMLHEWLITFPASETEVRAQLQNLPQFRSSLLSNDSTTPVPHVHCSKSSIYINATHNDMPYFWKGSFEPHLYGATLMRGQVEMPLRSRVLSTILTSVSTLWMVLLITQTALEWSALSPRHIVSAALLCLCWMFLLAWYHFARTQARRDEHALETFWHEQGATLELLPRHPIWPWF